MLAYSFSGKVSTLLAVVRAYSIIKFWEKILPTRLLEAYSFINFEKVLSEVSSRSRLSVSSTPQKFKNLNWI